MVYSKSMNIKKAQDLTTGDHLVNNSSRVRCVRIQGTWVEVVFQHEWAKSVYFAVGFPVYVH